MPWWSSARLRRWRLKAGGLGQGTEALCQKLASYWPAPQLSEKRRCYLSLSARDTATPAARLCAIARAVRSRHPLSLCQESSPTLQPSGYASFVAPLLHILAPPAIYFSDTAAASRLGHLLPCRCSLAWVSRQAVSPFCRVEVACFASRRLCRLSSGRRRRDTTRCPWRPVVSFRCWPSTS